MNDIAHKVAERLYGGDKVKFEIIFYLLNYLKKVNGLQDYDEFTKSLSEGNLDGYMMDMIEFFEDFDLEKVADVLRKDADRIPDINIRIFKKVVEICEDENAVHLTDMEKLDKNSAKKMFKRICEMPDCTSKKIS